MQASERNGLLALAGNKSEGVQLMISFSLYFYLSMQVRKYRPTYLPTYLVSWRVISIPNRE